MGLIPYTAHSATRRKTAVTENWWFCCHFTLKAESIPGWFSVRYTVSFLRGLLRNKQKLV